MPYVTAAILAGSAIYGAVEAQDRKSDAKAGIERLKKMQPRFRTGQELRLEGESAIREGFTPEQQVNFRQGLVRQNNQARRIATDRNPNLSGAVNAAINYQNLGALNEFAAQDAALREQKIQQYIGLIGGQSNLQTQADIQSKREQETAYGNAKRQANADIYNSLMQLGYAGASAATAGGGRYGATTTTSAPLASNAAPSTTAMNPAPTYSVGSDAWAKNLYGNPVATPPPPYFGTTQFGAGAKPLGNSVPSRNAPIFDPYLTRYY